MFQLNFDLSVKLMLINVGNLLSRSRRYFEVDNYLPWIDMRLVEQSSKR